MTSPFQQVEAFSALHRQSEVLLLPNAWDLGSALLLAGAGFAALATTSGGLAASLGRPDYSVTAVESLAHATTICKAVGVPVTADLENGFADDPAGVADTVRAAVEAGLAGCSIEDATQDPAKPIYEFAAAVERVAAAAQAAHGDGSLFTLTARAENELSGVHDLRNTIRRLQAYEEAGADVVYAPGLSRIDDIKRLVNSVHVPVNVLMVPGGPTVRELEAVGVRRISVGSTFAFLAYGAMLNAAQELLRGAEVTWWAPARLARKRGKSCFRRQESEGS